MRLFPPGGRAIPARGGNPGNRRPPPPKPRLRGDGGWPGVAQVVMGAKDGPAPSRGKPRRRARVRAGRGRPALQGQGRPGETGPEPSIVPAGPLPSRPKPTERTAPWGTTLWPCVPRTRKDSLQVARRPEAGVLSEPSGPAQRLATASCHGVAAGDLSCEASSGAGSRKPQATCPAKPQAEREAGRVDVWTGLISTRPAWREPSPHTAPRCPADSGPRSR